MIMLVITHTLKANGHVQMNSKLPCYLAIETMYSIKTSARNCQMSRAFDLLICGL